MSNQLIKLPSDYKGTIQKLNELRDEAISDRDALNEQIRECEGQIAGYNAVISKAQQ